MPPTPSQSYADIISRVQSAEDATCSIVGDATGHPMWGVSMGTPGNGRRQVLVTGGVHGDEPAGVEAAVQFIEGVSTSNLDGFTFFVIPCVNPSGFEAGTRVNGAGQDINRAMSDDSVIESVTLRRLLRGRRFDLFFDLHEDYEATGFYMYEAQQQDQLLGHRVVEAVKQIGTIDGDENTDAGLDTPISEGLFGINPKWRDQGWSAYGYFEAAEHGILPETPSMAWPLAQRVQAHHTTLRVVLDHYNKESAS
jgi:murein peptide amidase A